jgi:hypothetical protein
MEWYVWVIIAVAVVLIGAGKVYFLNGINAKKKEKKTVTEEKDED